MANKINDLSEYLLNAEEEINMLYKKLELNSSTDAKDTFTEQEIERIYELYTKLTSDLL